MKSIILNLLALALCVSTISCGKQSRFDRHLNRADAAFAAGDYDTARIEYLNAMRIDGSNPRAITQLGLLYHDMGSLRQAAPFLGRARELDPNNLEVRFRIATLAISIGDRDRAMTEIDAILEQQPSHPEAPLLWTDIARTQEHIEETRERLATLRSALGDTATLLTAEAMLRIREQEIDEGETLARRATDLQPGFAPAHIAVGVVNLIQTNLDAAEQAFRTAAELSPVRSDRQMRYLQFRRDRGDVDDARRLGEALVKQAPDYLPASQFLAQLEFDQRQFPEAQRHLERIVSRDPAHYEANLLRARLHLAQEQPTEAVELLERLTTAYPRSPELRYQTALASLMTRDITKAHANASQAVQLNPESNEAVLLLGTLDIARGNFDAAITGLTGLLNRQPGNTRVAAALAQAYRGRGRLQDALGLYEQMATALPNDPQGPYNAGLVLRQLNRLDDARAQFERVLDLSPAAVAAVRQLVEIDLQTDRPDAALTRAQTFLQEQPDSAAAQLLVGQVQFSRGDHAAAETAARRALELQPEGREAQVLLARVLVASNRQDQALAELNALVERNTNDTGALILIASIHSETQAQAQAIAAYERALAVNPDLIIALNNLAYLYGTQTNRLDRAYDLARRARTLQPNDPAIADTLGWVQYQRGDYSEALTLLLEAAGRLPDVAELQYHLGAAHYMLGQEQPARIALESALRTTDPFTGRAEAERKLGVLNLDVTRADPAAIAALEAALQDQPRDLMGWLRLASIHSAVNARDQAVAALNRAIEVSPRALSPHLQLARLYAANPDHHTEALRLAKRARDLAPADPNVAMILGQLVFQAGDHAWALGLLQEAAQRLPQNAELLYHLAWAQYSVGRVNNALQTMRNAVAADPQFAYLTDAQRFLALAPLGADPDAARAQSDQVRAALQTDPNYAPALMASALSLQADQNPVSARETAERLLAQFPSFTPAERLLTLLYVSDPPDYAQAQKHGLRAREAYPTDPEVARALGIASYHQNDLRRAIELLTEAARQRSDDPQLLVRLGLAQHQLNRSAEARPNLERALQLDPNLTLAPEAKRVIDGQ